MKKKTMILLIMAFFFVNYLFPVSALELTDYNVLFHENGGSSVDMSSSYDMSYVFQEAIDPSLPAMSETETNILFEVAQINSDVTPDIVFSLYQNQYLGWIQNNGDSTYSLHMIDSLNLQLTSLKVVDIDLDNDLDIIGISTYNFVVIYYNDGLGNFTSSWLTQNLPFSVATDLEIGLIDGDIYPDIVVNSTQSDQVLCFFQTSLHTFTTEVPLLTGDYPYDIVLSDIDLDGDTDIAVSLYNNYQIIWAENNGNGSFTSSHILASTTANPTKLDYLDYDSDGDFDFISIEYGNILDSYFTVYLNESNLSYVKQQMYSYSSLLGGVYYDIDENGYLDFTEPLSGAIQTSLFNDKTSYDNWTMSITLPSQIKFSDVDGDGNNELIISSTDDYMFHVYNLVPTGYVLGYSLETTKKDYDFVGWYLDEALTSPVTFPYTLVGDTDLYAKWQEHAYTITYDLDGGVNHPQNPLSYTVSDTPVSLEIPTKEGYIFEGWYLEDSYLGNSISSITIGEEDLHDYSLYALWTESVYSLTFKDDEGQILWTDDFLYQADLSMISYPEGGKYGYEVSSWSSLIPNQMPSHNVEIIASYTLGNYNLIFDTLGGTSLDTIHQLYGSVVIAPSIPSVKMGYDFDGYYSDPSLETPYIFGFMPGEDTTVYLKWVAHDYQVQYVLDGGTNHGSNPTTFTVVDNSPLFAPTKVGYLFDGFYLAEDFSGGRITNTSSLEAEDTILYARWTITTFTVIFYEFDQETVLHTYYFDYGDPLLPLHSVTPTIVSGYTFSGWNQEIPDSMPAMNLEYYPIFNENTYQIEFHTVGGEALLNQTYDFNESLNLPIPEKEGYSFGGWYTDADYKNKFVSTTMPSHDLLLYAKWNQDYYSILFQVNGINFELELPFGSDIPWLTVPEITNYTFVGWSLNGEIVDDDTFKMPSHSITLVAVYVDETPPVVTGVTDNQVFFYNSQVEITFNEGSALLNDHPFSSGSVVTSPGEYTLVVTDIENNVTTIHFTIEDQTPFSWWVVILTLFVGGSVSTGVLFKKEIAKILFKK